MDIQNVAQSLPVAGCQGGTRTAAQTSGEGPFGQLLAETRGASPAQAAVQRQELLRQLADGDSAFYREMRASLRLQLEESEEEQKEQAVIDALTGLIDAMNAPKDVRRPPAALSTASIAGAASACEPDDPRRTQLELFMGRLNALGIYLDLDAVSGGESREDWRSLAQLLMDREEPIQQTTL